MSERILRPFGLGGFQLTAWLCFIALLSDRNRPEMVVDWDGGPGRGGARFGEVVYRDQNWREWALPFATPEAEPGIPDSEQYSTAEPDVLWSDDDGPSQWDALEALR